MGPGDGKATRTLSTEAFLCRWWGRIHRISLRDPQVLREDREDCEATTSNCVVDGVNVVNAVVMNLPIPGTVMVPPDNTIYA